MAWMRESGNISRCGTARWWLQWRSVEKVLECGTVRRSSKQQQQRQGAASSSKEQ
jgi:hypothetical protein